MSAPQKKPERPQVKKNGKNKCISRESNAGPIEPAVECNVSYRTRMATMDFTTKPLMLFYAWKILLLQLDMIQDNCLRETPWSQEILVPVYQWKCWGEWD